MKTARTCLCSLAIACAFAAPVALAEELSLAGTERWVALASSRDLDTAIGIAGLYRLEDARVVRSVNDWYGVVFGPVQAADMDALRASYDGWPDLPPDALLSRGDNYIETAWTPPPDAVTVSTEISAGEGAAISVGELTVNVTQTGSTVRLLGSTPASREFDVVTPELYLDFDVGVKVVRLDPATIHPQLVVTTYSGGAHCCTSTLILSERPGGAWDFTPGDDLDGSGYAFRDIDGDGAAELMSVDNSFLYTFGSYAGSNPPLKIARFAEGMLVDVSAEDAYRRFFRHELAGMAFRANANANPDIWGDNGFLAGWVATKARVGEFDDAWQRMLERYNPNSEWGIMVCPDGSDDCPFDDQTVLPFPEGLERHLRENGYIATAADSAPPPVLAAYGAVTATAVPETCFDGTDCAAGGCDIAVRIEGEAATMLLAALKAKVTVAPEMDDLGIPLYESRDGGLSCLDQATAFCELRLDTAEAALTRVPICE